MINRLSASFWLVLVSLLPISAVSEAVEPLYYNDWTMTTMPGEIRLAAGDPTDDADGDGLVNGFEFLWDFDPMVSEPGAYAHVRYLPGPPRMEVSVPVTAAGRVGIELGLLASSDLMAWTSTDFSESIVDQRRILSVPVSSDNPNFLRPQLIVATLDNPAGSISFTLQAENESWSSGAVETEWAGFTGAGYVNTTNATGEWVEFSVSLLQPGTYRVDLVLALGGTGERPHSLSINGITVESLPVTATAWDDWRTFSVDLPFQAGVNSLRITGTGSGGVANLDRVDIFAPQGPTYVHLSTSSFGPGSIVIDPFSSDGRYLLGSTVTLTAVPDEDAVFEGWSGDVVSSEASIEVVLNQDFDLQALFTADTGNYVPDFGLYGWATEAGGTTGGAGGTEITVSTYAALVAALTSDATQIIYVSGTITGVGDPIRVHSNKSILGIGSDAKLENLGLQIGWNSEFGQIGNVIIRNITFGTVLAPTDKVAVTYGGHHVWVDHCVFESPPTSNVDLYDGQLDITHAGDYVTVSWCRFIQHNKNILMGHSEGNGSEDTGHLRATFHHNEFRNTKSRNPSVRFGTVHVFNNYYNTISDYGIASRLEAQVVVENNYFLNVLQPMNADSGLSDIPGHIRGQESNIYIGCGPNSIISTPATWIPPYPYSLDDPSLVPAAVQLYAGTGVVTW